jgi:hypothetical protein
MRLVWTEIAKNYASFQSPNELEQMKTVMRRLADPLDIDAAVELQVRRASGFHDDFLEVNYVRIDAPVQAPVFVAYAFLNRDGERVLCLLAFEKLVADVPSMAWQFYVNELFDHLIKTGGLPKKV